MSEKETALAFLELFKQANSLPKKSVDVVPVLRADNTSRSFLTMMKMLSEKRGREEDGTVGINWSDPVEYIPSKYPKSDAFQIVSDIGARLALSQENSVVFLISSENLNYIIDMSRLNRELTQRQWFVKGKKIFNENKYFYITKTRLKAILQLLYLLFALHYRSFAH